jgi:superfamily II DNA or RNA helicase
MDTSFGIHIENEDCLQQITVDINTKKLELYDWQHRGIDYFFSHNCKAIYQVATGAGKTIFAIEIVKRLHKINPDLRCLIVCPKNVIVETGWYQELYRAGYNIPDIGIFYGMGREYAKVTITNMQSLRNVALEIFDVIILDEIHNYGTKRLLKIFNENSFKYMIGLSATVERMDNAHWELLKLFEYNIFKYSPNDAINEGVLNSFNFYNISVEMDLDSYEEYLELTQNINIVLQAGGGYSRIMRMNSGLKFKMLKLMNRRKQLVCNYVRKFDVAKFICLKHKNEKTLIFNQFNIQTNKLYWHLLDSGIKSKTVHSGINKEQIIKNLKDFKINKVNTLLTTKVLDEGFNLPAIEIAIIMAGDSTAKQTIQRLGRVLRKKERESVLYQIYCKGTIEEEQAIERAKLFKQLASYYNEYEYKLTDNELVLDGRK